MHYLYEIRSFTGFPSHGFPQTPPVTLLIRILSRGRRRVGAGLPLAIILPYLICSKKNKLSFDRRNIS